MASCGLVRLCAGSVRLLVGSFDDFRLLCSFCGPVYICSDRKTSYSHLHLGADEEHAGGNQSSSGLLRARLEIGT